MNLFNLNLKNILLIFILAIYSCNSEKELEPADVVNLDKELVEEILVLPSQVVSAAYKQLNPKEKVFLWQRHFENLKKENTFNVKQLEHLMLIERLNDEALFNRVDNIEFSVKMEELETAWIKKALDEAIFTIQEIHLFVTIKGIGKDAKDSMISTSNLKTLAKATKCECYYNLGCPELKCDDNDNCKDPENKSEDCGILGSTTCSGRCGVDAKPIVN